MALVPVCSVRETVAFLRDPPGFTTGPGLGLGDFYRVRLPGYRLHVVTDPELVERILVSQAAHFEKSRLYWRELRRSFGDSMGSLEGPGWEYLHEAQRPFFTPEAVGRYLPVVEQQTRLHLRRLRQGLESQPEVPVLDSLAELNARIVLSVLFGQDDEPAAAEIAQRIAGGHEIIGWRAKFPWRPALGWLNGLNPRARRHEKYLDDYALRVRESAASSDPRLLLHALMRIAEDPQAPPFPRALVRNEIVFHLGASTETQATAAGWTLYLLWKHPRILERLRDEVWRVAGDSVVSFPQVASLTYTRQVLQEALRLFPPVYAITRDCVQPTELRGYRARRGQAFLISVCGLHRSPRLWDDPGHFRPERFQPDRAASIGKHQYLPFGAGRHVCIGRHLALPGLVLTVAHFAQQFDWTFCDPDVRPVARPSLKPSGSFRAKLRRRAAAPELRA